MVHNISPTESLPTSADVIDHALHVIHSANPELMPVHAVFRIKDTPSLCSIRLRDDVALLDVKPRPDLLAPWIGLLRNHNPEWEVDWAPKKDRRLWVVLKAVDGEAVDRGIRTVELARQELQRMGYPPVGGFVMASSGSVVIKMASLQSAQSLQSKKTLKIPILAEHLLIIDRSSFPTVQPEWAFELIITGLDIYDDANVIKMVLDKYFCESYVQDGQTQWHHSRIVDDVYYCLVMRDWDATRQVLKDKDKFEERFSMMLPYLGFPRLIFEFNSAGGLHKSIASVRKLKTAASRKLSDLYSQIHKLRRDMDRGFDQRHKRIGAHQQVLCTLSSIVTTLNDRIQNQSYSILALQNCSILQDRKTVIDTF